MIKRAYAKLNLGLHVDSEVSDGYHNLDMIVDRINLCDLIYIRKSKDLHVICDGIKEEDNIVYKIASFFKELHNVKMGATITIKKRIPVCAGLGGGSSDAATVLKALNKLWRVNASIEELRLVAIANGSDIPLFLYNNKVRVKETGNEIEVINSKDKFYYLIIKPELGFSTKEVYDGFTSSTSSACMLYQALKDGKKDDVIKLIFNDLSLSAYKLDRNNPRIEDSIKNIKKTIKELSIDANVQMTGAGSAFFIIAKDKREISAIKRAIFNDFLKIYQKTSIF